MVGPDAMGSASSVVRKPLREQNADEVAAALSHDEKMEVYSHVVRAKGITGEMVYSMPLETLVGELDISDHALVNHLGALVAYEKSPLAQAEAHRASLAASAAATGEPGEESAEQLEGEQKMMKLVRESLKGTGTTMGEALADMDEVGLGVSYEDTPRDEEAQRVAPAPDPAALANSPARGKRLSNSNLRGSAIGAPAGRAGD